MKTITKRLKSIPLLAIKDALKVHPADSAIDAVSTLIGELCKHLNTPDRVAFLAGVEHELAVHLKPFSAVAPTPATLGLPVEIVSGVGLKLRAVKVLPVHRDGKAFLQVHVERAN
jgi:hypothetical protein